MLSSIQFRLHSTEIIVNYNNNVKHGKQNRKIKLTLAQKFALNTKPTNQPEGLKLHKYVNIKHESK